MGMIGTLVRVVLKSEIRDRMVWNWGYEIGIEKTARLLKMMIGEYDKVNHNHKPYIGLLKTDSWPEKFFQRRPSRASL